MNVIPCGTCQYSSKVKIFTFEHFSDVFFNFFKILLCTLSIKDGGLIFNEQALKNMTRDMYFIRPVSIPEGKIIGGGVGKPPPPPSPSLIDKNSPIGIGFKML